jgi:hypothetical protein
MGENQQGNVETDWPPDSNGLPSVQCIAVSGKALLRCLDPFAGGGCAGARPLTDRGPSHRKPLHSATRLAHRELRM